MQGIFLYQVPEADPVIHRVWLECLDNDGMGEILDVIWEREVYKLIYDTINLPALEAWAT